MVLEVWIRLLADRRRSGIRAIASGPIRVPFTVVHE